MFLLTLRDLQFRAVRFGIAIIGTALVFAMVLIMSGLSARFRNEPRNTIKALGGEEAHWIVPEGVTGAFTSGATLPAGLVDEIEDGGGQATLVALVRHTAKVDGETKDVFLFGKEAGDVGNPQIVSGSAGGNEGEVVAGEETGMAVGDTATIGGEEFEVVGLTSDMTIFGGTPLLFMDIADVQNLVYGGQEVGTSIVVQGSVDKNLAFDEPQPDGSTETKRYEAKTYDETWQDALRPLEKPVGAINAVQILLWAVAATIIGAVVYLSALERRRDFAVMKAVGASSRGLLGGLAAQSILIALIAAVVAAGIQQLLVPVFPIPIQVPMSAYVQLPILALIAGALASLGGLRKAVNVDPALAFSGPGG